MKNNIKRIMYLMIVIISLITLTGCFDKVYDKASEKLNARNDKAISLGSWENDVYTNDFLNLRYTKKEGWERYSDEQIAELLDVGSEYLSDNNKYMTEVAKLTTVTYLMASDPNTNSNVILMTEKTAIAGIDVNKYLSTLKTNLSSNENLNYEFEDIKKQTINGVSYTVLEAKVSTNGVNMFQKYYVRKQDKYFVGIIVTSTVSEEELDSIANDFEKLN